MYGRAAQRAAARALGVPGIRGGKERSTPLFEVVQRVLDRVVAVDCKLDTRSGIVRMTPVAADMDDLVRVWHEDAGEKLPLKAHAARWREIESARRAVQSSPPPLLTCACACAVRGVRLLLIPMTPATLKKS